MKNHSTAVTYKNRFDGTSGCVMVTWQSDVVTDGDLLKADLIDAIGEWFMTDEGYAHFDETFNIGDLSQCLPLAGLQALLQERHIHQLALSHHSSEYCDWDYADLLFDRSTDEVYDAAEDRKTMPRGTDEIRDTGERSEDHSRE